MGFRFQMSSPFSDESFLYPILADFFNYFRWQIYIAFYPLFSTARKNIIVLVPEPDLDEPRILTVFNNVLDYGSDSEESDLLTKQLILDRLTCEVYGFDDPAGSDSSSSSSCVVCLSGLKEGDQVRRLECRHVFHKQCFDGWLDLLNFNCPLCRTPILSEEEGVAEVDQKAI